MTEEELDDWAGQVRFLFAHTEGYLPHEATLETVISLARRGLASQWRDISTAPKDGTRILARNYYTQFVTWKTVPRRSNQMENVSGWVTDFGDMIVPTHWLPLPAPPPVPQGMEDAMVNPNLQTPKQGKSSPSKAPRQRQGLVRATASTRKPSETFGPATDGNTCNELRPRPNRKRNRLCRRVLPSLPSR